MTDRPDTLGDVELDRLLDRNLPPRPHHEQTDHGSSLIELAMLLVIGCVVVSKAIAG